MAHRQYRSRDASGADDSLFGATSGKASKRLPANSVVLSAAELDRIKGLSKIRTSADIAAEAAEREKAQEEKHAAARARKERMLKLEEFAKAKSRKSDMELEREARKGAIRQMADKAMDENLDLVKMLNTLGARAAAFTIRDQQLEEKAVTDAKNKEYDQRMDVLMEIDRLTDLQKRDSMEKRRAARDTAARAPARVAREPPARMSLPSRSVRLVRRRRSRTAGTARAPAARPRRRPAQAPPREADRGPRGHRAPDRGAQEEEAPRGGDARAGEPGHARARVQV